MKKEAESEGEAIAAEKKRADLHEYLPSKSEPMIHFDFDKSNIKKDFHAILNELARVLKDKLPDVKIIVAGHTDSTGSETYNEELSLARADAVKSYLKLQHGISPERIITKGHGENNPIDTNETKEGRAKNRRAHIQIAE
jgi:outer membrane protein OmpA-like peptidoglycan-associated protein